MASVIDQRIARNLRQATDDLAEALLELYNVIDPDCPNDTDTDSIEPGVCIDPCGRKSCHHAGCLAGKLLALNSAVAEAVGNA